MSDPSSPWENSIVAPHHVDGFDDRGRKVIAECPEFKLIQVLHVPELTVERSPTVEMAYWKALGRISVAEDGTTTPEERINWMRAIMHLDFLTRFRKSGPLMPMETANCMRLLTNTIGQAVTKAATTYDPSKVDDRIAEAAAAFRNALTAYATTCGLRPRKKDRKIISREALVINIATHHFQHDRVRPNKQAIREEAEQLGFEISGKDQRGKWRDVFTAAGLGELPDAPPSLE